MNVLDNLIYLVVTLIVVQRNNVYSFTNLTVVILNTTNITTHQGNTIDLKAQVVTNGGRNKTIEVQWLRNEMKIANTSRLNQKIQRIFQLNVTYVFSTLRIKNVNLFDTGNWTFRVKADNVSITRTATVTVFAKPILKVQRDTLLIKEGDTIFIVCYWTQNGHETSFPLIRLAPYTVNERKTWISTSSSDNSYAVFMKKNAYASDAGQYRCINNQTSDVYSIQSKLVDVDIYTADDTICASSLDEYGLSWSNTYGGEIKYGSCPTDKTGYSSRYCDMYGIWDFTDLSYCAENDFDSLEQELDAIYAEMEDGLTTPTTISNAINSTLSGIKKISRNGSSSGGLNRTLQILSRIVTLANESDSINEESFFGSVDNILSTRNNDAWMTLSTKPNVSDAGTVMKLVERFSVYAKQKAKQSTRQGNTFIGENFYLDYAVLNSTNSITFPVIKSGTSYLSLPDQRLNVSENFYTAVIYKTIGDILSTNITNSSTNPGNKKMSVGTPVLSLKLDTAPDTLSPPLNLHFTTINKTGDLSSAICVYWDFAARSGRGAWKTDGCTRVSLSANEIVCQCNHLTNFAVLMSLDSTITNAYVISTISTIGSAISIFFAILTIVMHIILWSYVKSDVTVLLMNLCAALAISYTVFVTGTDSTDNEILCTAVTFLLHFMLLVMFSMMQCIGIHYLRNIVLASIWIKMADQFSRRSSLPWYLLFGWGIPLAISLSTVGLFYSKGTYVLPNICWLSTDSGSLYFFIVPAYLIVLINIIILIALIKVSVARLKPFQSLRKQTEDNGDSDNAAKARQALKNFGVLVPVLGFTWLFGILSINKDTEVFQYLFTISSSLQGLFIFLVHVPLNKKWKDAFAKKYRKVDKGKNTRQTGSESAASSHQVTRNNTAKSSLGSNHELTEVAKTTKEN